VEASPSFAVLFTDPRNPVTTVAATADSFDFRPLLSFFVAVTLTGANYLGMGLFFSSLTRNQVVAGVVTAVGMLLSLGAFVLRERLKDTAYTAWATLMNYFTFLGIWFDSLNGRLVLRDMVFQASMAVFWIFLTIKVLESRRWR
jgi:hypothetical protein